MVLAEALVKWIVLGSYESKPRSPDCTFSPLRRGKGPPKAVAHVTFTGHERYNKTPHLLR
jgi:hypothetical protein